MAFLYDDIRKLVDFYFLLHVLRSLITTQLGRIISDIQQNSWSIQTFLCFNNKKTHTIKTQHYKIAYHSKIQDLSSASTVHYVPDIQTHSHLLLACWQQKGTDASTCLGDVTFKQLSQYIRALETPQ